MIRAHSFDVFDTLLVRTRARSVDLLRATAQRVVRASDDPPGRAELVAELVRRRQGAELELIERLRVDAVGLDQIYAELDDLIALGVDPVELQRAELDIERSEVRAVRAGREMVDRARALGRRIVFVSDMYLPGPAIRESLERFAIARPGDGLYVSGELGISKRSGRLFGHVLRAEGLRADELVHSGDDPLTDIASPRRLGILVEPLGAARLNRLEQDVLSRSTGQRDVVAHLVGATRAARVAQVRQDSENAHAAALGASVAGPLFAGFVSWVLGRAREQNLQRLYFVARDGQALLRVAEQLVRPGDPECRYLHGSRQAWLLPAVERVDRTDLRWVLEPELAAPRALLAKLGVDAEEVAAELRAEGLGADGRLTAGSLDRFWATVAAISPLVLDRAARDRELTADYFAQEGLLDNDRWALVDVGWRLSAQRAVRRILSQVGRPRDVLGFYLGISRKRASLAETGPFYAYLLEDTAPDLPDSWVWSNTTLIEQVLAMADHGSCTGYTREAGRVEPVLRPLAPDRRRDALRECMRATMLGAARELCSAGLLDAHQGAVRDAAVLAGRLAVEQPSTAEARALGWIPVTDDQNETRTRQLAPPLSTGDIWFRARGALGLPVIPDFDTVSRWPEASVAASPALTRGLLGALRSARALAAHVRHRRA